jgi:ABC-2 type transport system permease protein
MSYRVDFWLSAVVAFVAEVGLAWFLWGAIYAESGRTEVAGWSREGMVLYSIATILLGTLVRGREFGGGAMSQEIYEGTLSRYLVYPVPYLGFKYAQQAGGMSPALVNLALFGVATVLVLPVPPDVPITPLSVAMGLTAVAVANLLHFLLSWPIQAVAFWADNVWSLAVAQRLVTGLLGGAMLPLSAFPEAVQGVLAPLPFRYLFGFPAEALLGRVSVAGWLEGLAVAGAWCVAFALLGRAVWRRGSLRYTGVGM